VREDVSATLHIRHAPLQEGSLNGTMHMSPPSSINLAEAWKPWMHTCMEMVGAREFPCGQGLLSTQQRLECVQAADHAGKSHERDALCQGTVSNVHRLG